MTGHPTYQEVTLAIKWLKNNKSPGSDGIPAEYVKVSGDVLAEHLHIVLQKIWSEEELPPYLTLENAFSDNQIKTI